MSDENKLETPMDADEKQNTEAEEKPNLPKGDLERFYEQFRNVPIKYLDMFIIACFVLLMAIIAFGIWRAKF